MKLYTRIAKFTKKIGNPDKSKTQNIINLITFLCSASGRELIKTKIKQYVFNQDVNNPHNYNKWIRNRINVNILEGQYKSVIKSLKLQPVISIVIPVYNPPIKYLDSAIQSVIQQLYPNWQLCLADDNSPDPEVKQLLQKYAESDARIKVVIRPTNGHISACSNSALALATGDYILFMDHDDLLTPNCLFEFVWHINKFPENKIIYSDEDKIDDKGIYSFPHFKPDWAPDNLLSRNYMGHVIVIEKQLMDKLQGFRLGFEGSQDHDLLLRATELTDNIGHIAKVLYHWRIHELSVSQSSEAKPYAYLAAEKALEEALVRRNTPGKIEHIPNILGGYRIRYQIKKFEKVSIIIPTKDHVKLLKTAIDSIIEKTEYPDYEIILLNNNSKTPEFFDFVAEYTKKYSNIFHCYDANFPFNFATLMNFGVSKSKGAYLLFLNNDVEIIDKDWMNEMVSFAQREKTGVVGVKLLFADDTVQHAGVVLGLGGAAGHVFYKFHKSQGGYFNYLVSLNNYSSLTAACLMCRKTVFDEVEGFDENLSVEYNDIDFCLKIMAKGYFNVYAPDVVLYHYESSTRGHPFHSKESFAQHEIDFAYFNSKWAMYIKNDPFYNPNLSIEHDDFRLKND